MSGLVVFEIIGIHKEWFVMMMIEKDWRNEKEKEKEKENY